MSEAIARVVREQIRALGAYPVACGEGMIKLDAMENPHAFPAELRAGLAAALSDAALNRYPPADGGRLKHALRAAMQVPAACDILLGNGSDEILQIIALAAARPGASLLSVEPAFVMFKMIATFTGLRHVGVPLQTDFSLDLPTWLDAIDRERPALIVLASPNNPTGNVFSHVQIESTIDAAAAVGALVVVDEAYYPFARENFMDGIARHPNAVLMRTVSKLGLAGIRLGFLVGAPAWLAEFDKVRLPYNINALTQAAATFALQHYPLFQAQAAAIVAERARLALALDALPGVERFASEANFILVRVPDAERTFAALLEARILVKNTSRAHPLLVNTLRLTVGTRAENDLLLAALDATLRRPR